MRNRDNTDVWTAIVIGAIVGIGATLLVRARQEDDSNAIMKALEPVKKQAGRAAHTAGRVIRRRAKQAGEAGEELLSSSRDVLSDLRDGASEIVRDTRDELRKAARDSIADARRAARKAARTALR